jgi:phage protein D
MPATATSETRLRSARPTIEIAGRENAQLASGLLSLQISENVEGLYHCEATFGNWGPINNTTGFLYFGRDVLDFGKAFKVKIGTESIFEGRISALEAVFPEGRSPEVRVLAEDRFQDLRMTRRTRSFVESSDADVIQRIASDHGLRPTVDVQGPTHKMVAQVNQSDLAFARERARAIGAELWMEGSSLFAKARSGRNGSTLTLSYGRDLREFIVTADLAGQRTAVSVNGWDVAGKSGLTYEATDSVLSGELNGGESGASILSSAFGDRKEALAHFVPINSQEAQSRAEAFFRMTGRRFVVGHGVAEASAQLRVGTTVDLRGIGPLFEGKYYVAQVRHRFDGARGFRTEFTAERPGLGRP